jgi:hypothetical protein
MTDSYLSSSCATFPECFDEAVDAIEISEALRWLSLRQGATTITFQLRMPSWHARRIEDAVGNEDEYGAAMTRSCEDQVSRLQKVWDRCIPPRSIWRHPLRFDRLHSVAFRGPIQCLKKLLQDDLIHHQDTPVAGVIMADPVQTPEALSEQHLALRVANDEVMNVIQSVIPLAIEQARLLGDSASSEFLAAIQKEGAIPSSSWDRLQQVFAAAYGRSDPVGERNRLMELIGRTQEYVDELGIGPFAHWGANLGYGHTVCVVDSGADESHPMLQLKIKDYVRFDAAGQRKDAYACMDNACHGTKICTAIAGRPIRFAELDFPGNRELRLGIAPGSKLVVISALAGDFRQEKRHPHSIDCRLGVGGSSRVEASLRSRQRQCRGWATHV